MNRMACTWASVALFLLAPRVCCGQGNLIYGDSSFETGYGIWDKTGAIDSTTAKQVGLKVRASPGGEEETLLYYDTQAKRLVFDSTRSGVAGRRVVERAPLELKDGEPLKLRVFVDKSVVEIYANDRQAICRRVYPGRPDSLGVALFATGGKATLSSVRAWEMMPSNPY